jgi:transposase-like protein/ribosomal protein L37AE/L43A
MFEEWFSSEERVRNYVEAVRFRHTMACPFCGVLELKKAAPDRWWCSSCRRNVSLTSGTFLQGTRIPLRTWMAACWLMTQTKNGISALSFSAMYELPYNSTWLMFQKIRAAMDQTGRDRLRGEVEIDETWVGGREVGGRGKGSDRKSVVIVAVELVTAANGATKIGRVRLERAHDAGTLSIERFLERHVEPGTILYSDGNAAYVNAVNRFAAKGITYKLDQTVINGNPAPAASLLLHVHRVISLFKRWQLGTFQGGVRGQHLDAYLSEYTFRFNRRTSRSRGLLFYRLVCSLTDPGQAVRYAELRKNLDNQFKAARTHKRAVNKYKKTADAEKQASAYQRRKARKAAAAAGLDPDPFEPLDDVEPVRVVPGSLHVSDIEAF